MTEKHYTELEKLQVMLSHWLQHNQSHAAEYEKWAEVARKAGHPDAAGHIEQALDLLDKADKTLQKALDCVGGPVSGHHHGHHHHHHND